MKYRFFDFEVTPNWWLCVFGDIDSETKIITEDIKDSFKIVNSDMTNERDKLLNLMREEDTVLFGYNIKGYDLVIANGIYQGFSPQEIKIINDIIINPACKWSSKEHYKLEPFTRKRLSGVIYQDLLDDNVGSLKEKESIIGLSVLESSVDFNKENLTQQDKEDMTYYCKQDVYASIQYYLKISKPYVNTKLILGKHFNIPLDVCYKSTNAKLVGIALGAKRHTFSDDERLDIQLPKKIEKYCYDNLPYNIINKILESPEGFKINLFENQVSFGNGGIHSTYIGNYKTPPCLYIETDDEYVLVNVDAASYYPSQMIQFNLLSRAVSNPQIFIDIFNERIAIKHKENKTPEDDEIQLADKLILNTTFGASGNKYLDLYDPYMCTSVCRVGQIFLAALAYKMYKTIPNLKIIQTNTDGICCYLPRKELNRLDALQKEWSEVSGINMDRDDIIKIWQRDVNNYLMLIKEKGKIKTKLKGEWLNDTYIRPGTNKVGGVFAFASSKAVINYLTNGNDIVESIVSNTNLEDFVMNCTKGPTYSAVVQRFADGHEETLFKANRVIASKNGYNGMLYKIKKYKDKLSYTKMPSIPEHCKLINDDISHYDFNKDIKPDLDYMFYIEQCAELLNIEWLQIHHHNIINNYDFKYFE